MTTGKIKELTDLSRDIKAFADTLPSREEWNGDRIAQVFDGLKITADGHRDRWLSIADKYRKQTNFTGAMQRARSGYNKGAALKPFSWKADSTRRDYLS